MKEWTVNEYANDPQNIWGRVVSTTAVYAAIKEGRLKSKPVGSTTLIVDPIVSGVIEDRVLILPDKPQSDGFVKAEHTIPLAETGEVIHVGPGVKDGQPMVLEPGMRVRFNNNKISCKFKDGDSEYFVMHQTDVHLIL